MTKDEKFMIALYEASGEQGNLSCALNRYEVGERIGLQKKGVDAICRLLIQANFIRKADEDDFVRLTDHGKNLALDLINS